MPSTSGSNKISAISSAVEAAGILKSAGICSDIRNPNTMGVVTKHATVVTPVSAMDKAIWPRPKNVNTFDIVPPGLAAHRARPIALPVSSENTASKTYATSGTASTCTTTPTDIAHGFFATATKSRTFNVAPMPSMARANWVAANQYS